jgi:glutamate-1-semialdehyde 2,1-aminomutase
MLFATASEIEAQVAERISALVPGAERVRFANTGTEATMAAIRIARALTGRPLVVKFEGHYHGWFDGIFVSVGYDPVLSGWSEHPATVPSTAGIPDGSAADTVVCAWNDAELLADCLAGHEGRVAAVITEPVMANMGVIPPRPGYLDEMRRLCDKHGAMLIVDETVTGFRLHPGGCQALYGVTGDLATFGKALGAGLPLAAVTGPAGVMDVLAGGRVLHYGTQNAPNLALSVTAESLDMLTEDDGAAWNAMTRRGERLAQGLADAFAAASIAAVVQGVGPMLQVLPLRAGHEETEAIHDMRDFCTHADPVIYRRFVHQLFGLGVYASPAHLLHMIVSTAHTDAYIDAAVEAVHTAAARLGAGRRSASRATGPRRRCRTGRATPCSSRRATWRASGWPAAARSCSLRTRPGSTSPTTCSTSSTPSSSWAGTTSTRPTPARSRTRPSARSARAATRSSSRSSAGPWTATSRCSASAAASRC